MNRKNQLFKTRFPHTYSIVARDSKTGEMGVGVQSHYFSVGSVVPWGESGLGVVATQSFVNKSFGLRGLELLRNGKRPEEAIEVLLSDDPAKEMRQVAMLDVQGRVAAHTGSKCIKCAGHEVGENYSVQANLMLSDEVWSRMARAFEKNTEYSLAERILKSLEAAETIGGDIRGKQSAAILIVHGTPVVNKWEDPLIDLRVEDHEEPLKELKRLLRLHKAYMHLDNGDLALESGDTEKAFASYHVALKMFPDNLEMKFWTAVNYANNKNLKEALILFEEIFKRDNNWRTLTQRLPEAGLLKLSNDDLRKILEL
jgi:uncharacterized Ntn-hydrolase superfamily protein